MEGEPGVYRIFDTFNDEGAREAHLNGDAGQELAANADKLLSVAHWPFLSDAGRVVQKDLDLAEYTDPLHNPMIPHVMFLNRISSSTRSTAGRIGTLRRLK